MDGDLTLVSFSDRAFSRPGIARFAHELIDERTPPSFSSSDATKSNCPLFAGDRRQGRSTEVHRLSNAKNGPNTDTCSQVGDGIVDLRKWSPIRDQPLQIQLPCACQLSEHRNISLRITAAQETSNQRLLTNR
jgi:hypothetical protein